MKLVDVYSVSNAARVLYKLLEERSTEDEFTNISHRKLPSMKEHLTFVMGKPYRAWYLAQVDDRYIGSLTLTDRNEVGIVLFRAERGKGYGKRALLALMDSHQPLPSVPSKVPAKFVANINPNNERSLRLFRSVGFGGPIQVTLESP